MMVAHTQKQENPGMTTKDITDRVLSIGANYINCAATRETIASLSQELARLIQECHAERVRPILLDLGVPPEWREVSGFRVKYNPNGNLDITPAWGACNPLTINMHDRARIIEETEQFVIVEGD
jgi:hypothetical protein